MRQPASGAAAGTRAAAAPAGVRAGLAGGLLAAAAVRAAYAGLLHRPPGGRETWARTNHRAERVTLLAGPAVAGAAVSAAVMPWLPARTRAAMAAAGAAAAGLGCYDDLAGGGDMRGFRGHLGSLARGQVTTGAVKLAGIGAAGLAAAAALGGRPGDVIINAGLIAATANLVNLFDLRPGRAIKVTTAAAALVAAAARRPARASGWHPAAVPAGAALAVLRDDLAERAMLGDAGANALGAMLGVAAAASLPRAARITALAGIVALTAASEAVSFTEVIERTPLLRRADMLGRRPPAGTAGLRQRHGAAGSGAGQQPEGHAASRAARPRALIPEQAAADLP